MPIDRSKYPSNWDEISLRIRKSRADDRCECAGQCDLHEYRCTAINNTPHPVTGSKVVLTVAHLDQDTKNNLDTNLLAMCQRCHLTYDRNYYKKQRLAWISQLSDPDLEALLYAVDNFGTDVLGDTFRSIAKGMWGDEVIESFDTINELLQAEWDKRHDPPAELLIGD